ncbi:hypothetical protein Pmani_021349 [Petrolisthes manimaculis]|uniref:Cdc6 C-terminal domain-containing protein n=1 Tax=Petrolisthes manimaculis TaxID=1843537 RepID=A0AAE1U3B2_9EUCA|nr:hypothetical protein Pmani_021349 [Petrolisthes manimaculis]
MRKLTQSGLHNNNLESPVKKSTVRTLNLMESSPRRSPRKLTQSPSQRLKSDEVQGSPAAAQRKRDVVNLCKPDAAIYKNICIELNIDAGGTEKDNKNNIEKTICMSKLPILLLLDEMDQLSSKNESVLYTVFEWPSLNQSKLILVGIANSLDLTDRTLPRLQARPNLKPMLMHFPPYSKKQIITIINHRIAQAGLDGIEIIRPSAIQLLAGKVSAVAGDVRKALDVCRRAVEMCEGNFHDVYTRVCKKRQISSLNQSEFLSLCTLLESRAMLTLKLAKEIRSSKVILRLNADEAEDTLGDRSLLASVLEDTESLGNLCKKKK